MSGQSPHDGVSAGASKYGTTLNSRPVRRVADFHGVPVHIEFDKGETKRGIGDYGELWENTYEYPYGEIPDSRTLADGDGVDVYLGNDENAPMVFVVHQIKRNGDYDEPKVMLNFAERREALRAYVLHGPSNRIGAVDEMTVDEFINGFLASNRKLDGRRIP